MPIMKTVKKYGNSGGVYVPKDWIGGRVRIELLEEPKDPVKDVVSKMPLEHIISGILYGSAARKELSDESDIDILLVSDGDVEIKVPAELKKKYDIQVKTIEDVRNALVHDPIFYKMINDEAVAFINHQFLSTLKMGKAEFYGVEKRVELIESSLNITKELLKASDNVTNIVYPLVMHSKEILLIEYFLTNKKYSTKSLKKEMLSEGITMKEFSVIMNAYRAGRDGERIPAHSLAKDTIMKLVSFLEGKIAYVTKKRAKKGIRSLERQIEIHKLKLRKAQSEGNIGLSNYYEKELEHFDQAKKKRENKPVPKKKRQRVA
ncbi:MAG: nucleotidyltransferase domain-containing protein [Candidatus Aenigmarchaeota archaeon]|nr:nucleotidyltransferase domain-containing protein [Candidatus Aenigmarchaeota archaeon]